MANIYRNYKKYDEAIKLHTTIMENVLPDTVTFADLLYRRGGSYERLGKFPKHLKDKNKKLNDIVNKYYFNYKDLQDELLELYFTDPNELHLLKDMNENSLTIKLIELSRKIKLK